MADTQKVEEVLTLVLNEILQAASEARKEEEKILGRKLTPLESKRLAEMVERQTHLVFNVLK